MMNGYDMNGWGWAGMTLMAVVTVAIVGLVVWAIARRPGDQQAHAPSARSKFKFCNFFVIRNDRPAFSLWTSGNPRYEARGSLKLRTHIVIK